MRGCLRVYTKRSFFAPTCVHGMDFFLLFVHNLRFPEGLLCTIILLSAALMMRIRHNSILKSVVLCTIISS